MEYTEVNIRLKEVNPFADIATFREGFKNELATNMYTRGNNPTVNILRQKFAAMEGSEDALVFASGVAFVGGAGVVLRCGGGCSFRLRIHFFNSCDWRHPCPVFGYASIAVLAMGKYSPLQHQASFCSCSG